MFTLSLTNLTSEVHKLFSVRSQVIQTKGLGATGDLSPLIGCTCVNDCGCAFVFIQFLNIQSYIDLFKNRPVISRQFRVAHNLPLKRGSRLCTKCRSPDSLSSQHSHPAPCDQQHVTASLAPQCLCNVGKGSQHFINTCAMSCYIWNT